MAQTSSPSNIMDKRMCLKRKRNSTDDDVENVPPRKISSKLEDESELEPPAHNVVVESTSSSSEDEESHEDQLEQPRSVFTDLDFNSESLLSPPSVPDLQNYVLSPLENVARGDSTPHSNKRASTSKAEDETPPKRKCPLPMTTWGDPEELWENMCECDEESAAMKDPNMFDYHPNLQPRMRAILLDWLNEVCEVYKLQRETFHLTVDYVDRYLSATRDVPKSRLQLIGITCLFVAAKVEEVYPPKLAEFAYVTDGACAAADILREELCVLRALRWDLAPLTPLGWLALLLQLAAPPAGAPAAYCAALPQYSAAQFARAATLLDLAALLPRHARYRASLLAAAALAATRGPALAARVSGYSEAALRECVRWLRGLQAALAAAGPDAPALRRADAEHLPPCAALRALCPRLQPDECHRVQAHHATIAMYDWVVSHEAELEASAAELEAGAVELEADATELEADATGLAHVFPPTPPQSGRKSPPPAAATPHAAPARRPEAASGAEC